MLLAQLFLRLVGLDPVLMCCLTLELPSKYRGQSSADLDPC